MHDNDNTVLEFTRHLKRSVQAMGAQLVGVADVEPLRELETVPADLLDPFSRAVSFAVSVPAAVFEPIADAPTPLYAAVYQTANRFLDEIAFRTCALLDEGGHRSLPIPASSMVDRERWLGALTHKAVARMAGIGWQGRNLLLVTARYGSRVRLATVLTDAPLEVDGPVKNRCGACTRCRDACPVGAIKGVRTQTRYRTRDEALYFSRCLEKLTGEFASLPHVGVPICGICIRACPFSLKGRHVRPLTG